MSISNTTTANGYDDSISALSAGIRSTPPLAFPPDNVPFRQDAVTDLRNKIVPYPLEYGKKEYPFVPGEQLDSSIPLLRQLQRVPDLFRIPVEGGFLLYAPAKRLLSWLRTDQTCKLADLCLPAELAFLAPFVEQRSIDLRSIELSVNAPGSIPTDLFILPTTRCQFCCRYCFSNANEGDLVDMPVGMALDAVDFCLKNVLLQDRGLLFVRFLGGGEPTVHWPLLKETVLRARSVAGKAGLPSWISVVTNGLLSREKAAWLAENMDEITFSIDGPPDIQDFNRPLSNGSASSGYVCRAVDETAKRRGNYLFRATIPREQSERMPEIVEYFLERFDVKRICLEPLSECGRCNATNSKTPDQDSFVEAFIAARNIGRSRNAVVEYSSANIGRISCWFCTTTGRQFGLNPDGSVTACGEVDLFYKKHNELFLYGKYLPDMRSFELEPGKVESHRKRTVDGLPYCANCFAKYHCAGGCPIRALRDTGSPFNPFRGNCAKVRRIIADELAYLASTQLSSN
jgi:uncharacterized protein